MPRNTKENDIIKMCCRCCASKIGLVHLIGGVGIGFLIVHYFNLTDVLVWGWVLVGLGLLGHLFWKKEMMGK